MKIGIYFAFWEHEWGGDYHGYIDKVADLGFDVLELSCVGLPEKKEDLIALRDHARDRGLELTSGYGPSRDQDLSSSDPSVVENGIRYMTNVLKKLEIMDIHVVGGGLQTYWPADYSQPFDKEADWERSVKNIRRMAQVAGDCGVNLCLETLNRFESYLINTAKECRTFVEQVDHPNVKVMLDSFHMNIEEDSFEDAILTAGDLLGHFHIGEANRKVPGRGHLPWASIGKALNQVGYEGACVMEPFVMRGGTIGKQIYVWRDLEPDTSEAALDAMAKESLEYTRKAFA